MTLIVKFYIEGKTFSIVKIVTDMQEYDCAIEVPRPITSLYGFALTMNKYDSTADQNGPTVSKQCGLKMKLVRVWFTQYGVHESLVLQWTSVPKKSIFVNLN